jgi:hypothetical protein
MQPGGLHLVPLNLLDESAISHLNIQDIGVNTHLVIDAHIADGTIHFTEASIDHTAISNIGVNSHAAIDTHIADGNIHFADSGVDGIPYVRLDNGWATLASQGAIIGPTIDHGVLLGLADDDHINYFFALGRAGGQFMIGGTNPADGITMQSNTTNTGAGRINMLTPVEFGPYSSSTAVYAFNYAATETGFGAFVGGGLNMSGIIAMNTSTFIYESFRGAPQITSGANPGFAAYTVMQALPSLIAGPGAGNRPLNATIINAGPRFNNPFAGARTTPSAIGVSNTPQLNPSVNGAVMNLTNISGFVFTPAWNTVAGSTANFGTIRGMWARNPGQVLFGSSAGTEIGAAYYGFDVDNITLNNGFGTMPVAAFRSAVAASASKYMLLNTGGAESDFGFGDIHLNDDTWLKLGNTVANPDIIIGWQTTQASLVFSSFFGVGGNPMYLRTTANDSWVFGHNNAGTADIGIGFNANAVSFGVIEPQPDTHNWFVRFEGPNNRQVQSAGVYSDVWWTAGGLIDVNGLAATEVNSFRIDANVTVLNGGSVQDQSGLFLAGMGFPGSGVATRIQSLRVTGRSRFDGNMNYGSLVGAQITADVNNLQLGILNSARAMNLLSSDDDWNITGIDSSIGYGQTGDSIYLYNTGSFDLILTSQDAASLAANRFITPEGLPYIIHPQRGIWIWYDDTGTDRWRIMSSFGHLERTLHLSGTQFRRYSLCINRLIKIGLVKSNIEGLNGVFVC